MSYDKVSDYLENAIDEMEAARDEAGMGTSMRISSLINQIRSLKEDTETIHDADD